MKILYLIYFDAFLVCFASAGSIIRQTQSKNDSRRLAQLVGGGKAKPGEFKGAVSGASLYVFSVNSLINHSNSSTDLNTNI